MSAVVQPTAMDRLCAAFRMLVRAELPTLTFLGTYEYAVQDVHGSVPNVTVDCSPTDTTIALPSLTNIAMRSAADGATGEPTKGNLCRVIFLNGDPSKPVITGTDSTVANAQISASGTAEVKAGTIKHVASGTAHLEGATLELTGAGVSGSIAANAGLFGTTEHVATVEAVVNMFINYTFLLNSMGPQSSWNTTFFNDPTLSTYLGLVTTWLTNCGIPSLPVGATPVGPPVGGGILWPTVAARITSVLGSKIPDVTGLIPSIGAPKFETG